MSWSPSNKEIEAVLRLDGAARYRHFIKRVADCEEVWGLWESDGWAVMGDDPGQELIPFWPHSSYAALCAIGSWNRYGPKAISLDDLQEKWLVGMKRDGHRLAVFPTPSGKGVIIDPAQCEQDLRDELSLYGARFPKRVDL